MKLPLLKMRPRYTPQLTHARIRIVYDDEFVTREETPNSIDQFIKQRTRWNQGFIQILFAGEGESSKTLPNSFWPSTC